VPEVLRTSKANLDLIHIGLTIAESNPVAADRLLDAVDKTCQLLATQPGMGRRRPELAANVRSFPVGQYIIFYREVPEGIQVLRVLHGARDLPGLFEGT
jgi:toxin ParE1/3/4